MRNKKWSDNTGFSLVEVIVVSVIVALLAAVSIPMYSSYVRNQKMTTVGNLAETGAAAANAYLRRTGVDPTVTQLNLYYDTTKYTVTVTASSNTVTVTSKQESEITASRNY